MSRKKAANPLNSNEVVGGDLDYEELLFEVSRYAAADADSRTKVSRLRREVRVLRDALHQKSQAEFAVKALPPQVKLEKGVVLFEKEDIEREEAVYLVHLSDLHIGTLIEAGTIVSQPHVEYSFDRLGQYLDIILKQSIREIVSSAHYDYQAVKVLFNGDLLNGEHLAESVRTNESNIQETLIRGIELCSNFLTGMFSALKKLGKPLPIDVTFTSGNHGRWDHNCPSADFVERNYDTYLGLGVRKSIESLKKNGICDYITVTVAADFEAVFQAFGLNYIVTHGNFAAADQRIKRAKDLGNALTERLYSYKLGAAERWKRPFAGAFIGHFHQQVNDRRYGVYVNGSPKGYDHYAEKLNLKIEPAMQSCHVLTRRGVVQNFDINLERPFMVAEQDEVAVLKNQTKDAFAA